MTIVVDETTALEARTYTVSTDLVLADEADEAKQPLHLLKNMNQPKHDDFVLPLFARDSHRYNATILNGRNTFRPYKNNAFVGDACMRSVDNGNNIY